MYVDMVHYVPYVQQKTHECQRCSIFPLLLHVVFESEKVFRCANSLLLMVSSISK